MFCFYMQKRARKNKLIENSKHNAECQFKAIGIYNIQQHYVYLKWLSILDYFENKQLKILENLLWHNVLNCLKEYWIVYGINLQLKHIYLICTMLIQFCCMYMLTSLTCIWTGIPVSKSYFNHSFAGVHCGDKYHY